MISASKDFTYLLMSISSDFKWVLIIDNGFLESCDFHSALKYYLLSQFTVMPFVNFGWAQLTWSTLTHGPLFHGLFRLPTDLKHTHNF